MKYLILAALLVGSNVQARVVCKANQCTAAEEKAQLLLKTICQKFSDVLMKQTGGAKMAPQDQKDWDDLNAYFPKWFGKKFDSNYCPQFQPIAMSHEVPLVPGGGK